MSAINGNYTITSPPLKDEDLRQLEKQTDLQILASKYTSMSQDHLRNEIYSLMMNRTNAQTRGIHNDHTYARPPNSDLEHTS